MKNSFLIIAFCLIGFGASAQLTPNAIGLRLSGEDGLGPEISYQRAVGDNNRFEFDLGFRDSRYYDAFKFTVLYHWVYNISGGLSWFAGFGAGIGYADYDRGAPYFANDPYDDGRVFGSLDGDFGLEYSFLEFDVPIQLALDLNPELEFMEYEYENGVGLDLDIALAIRYQF